MAEDLETEYKQGFRRALREVKRADDDLSLMSLLASAQGVRILEPIIAEEMAPVSGELDLHLTGESVDGHATNAAAFGELVRRMAEAVKVAVKDATGNARQTSGLLVDVGPGSVRATFKAPPNTDHEMFDIPEMEDEVRPVEDEYSEALRRISVVLGSGDPDEPDPEDESDGLAAAIQQIPGKARRELAKLLEEVKRQRWEVRGGFTQRGVSSEELTLTPAAAEYLQHRLDVPTSEVKPWSTEGYIDGHQWSKGKMYFQLADRSRTIAATFHNATIQHQVAKLASEENRRVHAEFTVHQVHGAAKTTSSYVLTSISAAAQE
jgi:hypothetical protein